MKKLIPLITFCFFSVEFLQAQNVGIGTTSPEYSLHVFNASGESSTGINATGTAAQALLNLSIDNRIDGNALALIKYRPGVAGTTSGIPKSNLSLITADAGGGALLIATNQASSLHFATNLVERMRITAAGNIGISEADPLALFHVLGKTAFPITAWVRDSVTTGPQRDALAASINTSVAGSAAVSGVSYEGSSAASLETTTYGVLGQSGTGYGVAGYSISSTALRGQSESGLALHTTGGVRLEGIGEDKGKVLMSDIAGNATWEFITGDSHNHFGETWTGNATAGLTIQNDNTAAASAGIRGVASGLGGNQTLGVYGYSTSTLGIGVVGIATPGAGYATYNGNSGVVGTSNTGSGVEGVSISGPGIYGLKHFSHTGPAGKFENANAANTSPVVQIFSNATNPIALELNNGFVKVSGANKTAFKHTTTGGNVLLNQTNLSYTSQASTDILIVTHDYNGIDGTYLNMPVGVYWNGSNWTIYLEAGTGEPMPAGVVFNVLVIKQ